MKKLIKMIITFFIRLFGKKKEEEVKQTVERIIEKFNNPQTPDHNNRKRTPGRHIQVVSLPNGRTRIIYH